MTFLNVRLRQTSFSKCYLLSSLFILEYVVYFMECSLYVGLYKNSPVVIFNGTFSFPQMSVENVAFEALNSVVSRQSMGKPMINKSLITPAVTELFFQGTN